MHQQWLFDKKLKKRYSRTIHGGMPSKGMRKEERPFSSKKWSHLILKSDKAKGKLSFLSPQNKIWIQQHLEKMAKRFGVTIGDYVNVGNHLHIKLKTGSRIQFQRFLKSTTGRIAAHVTGARKGRKFSAGPFWQGLAYTRVLKSHFEELRLKGYFEGNRVESKHGYKQREEFLEAFNAWIRRVRERTKNRAPPPKAAWV